MKWKDREKHKNIVIPKWGNKWPNINNDFISVADMQCLIDQINQSMIILHGTGKTCKTADLTDFVVYPSLTPPYQEIY